MKYKHLFFDLDHTLWDFERNSSEALTQIYGDYDLLELGVTSCDDLIATFLRINTDLWQAFDQGRLEHSYIREHRFRLVFEALDLSMPHFCKQLGESYLELLPKKSYLLDGALDVLEYSVRRGYILHLVTNGFDSIQRAKMASSGIDHFFKNVITYDKANAKKPDPKIFTCALEYAGAKVEECVMIGDNWEADIVGAKRCGLDTIFYNPGGVKFDEVPTFDIVHLRELKEIL
jgi:putative hydrolase of the HAD superfamily